MLLGQRIEQMENAGTAFASAEGLQFFKQNVLGNTVRSNPSGMDLIANF